MPHERRPPDHVEGPMRTDSWSDELRRGGWFGPVHVDLLRWEYRLTPDRARRLWGSFPNVNELPGPRREEFLDAVAGIVTDLGGVVEDPYVTAVYRTRPRHR